MLKANPIKECNNNKNPWILQQKKAHTFDVWA